MSIAFAGSGISLLALASYAYVDSVNQVSEQFKWIPIVGLSIIMFLNAVGI